MKAIEKIDREEVISTLEHEWTSELGRDRESVGPFWTSSG